MQTILIDLQPYVRMLSISRCPESRQDPHLKLKRKIKEEEIAL